MIIIFLRSIITFTILLILLRLMGKRQIGEMQPFELAITLIIADLACIPMTDLSIPLAYGIIAILTLFIIHQLISFIDRYSNKVSKFLSGKPSVVINSDGLNYQEIKKQNICIGDVQEAIRNKGYANFDEIEYGIFETNGKFTALEKSDFQRDVNKKTPLPLIIVEVGKINQHNMNIAGITKEALDKIMVQNNTKLKDIMILTLDNNGKIYLQTYKDKYVAFNIDFSKGENW